MRACRARLMRAAAYTFQVAAVDRQYAPTQRPTQRYDRYTDARAAIAGAHLAQRAIWSLRFAARRTGCLKRRGSNIRQAPRARTKPVSAFEGLGPRRGYERHGPENL